MLTEIGFYPSLGFNLLRNLIEPDNWKWCNRINEHIILGAIPFQSMKDDLINMQNVGGVVCCTELFELSMAYTSMDKTLWEKEGVRFHNIPMLDFYGSADRSAILDALAFIDSVVAHGKTVYIHCKAGRTRSTTIAACYLIWSKKMSAADAITTIQSIRPQVLLRTNHLASLEDFEMYTNQTK
uniref:TYR_PHOSPHATASE_2 domain-containing protein n=1 Tax=Rhabditophanes sp. KR3021 TaxID=114890 RepID=A0AC35TY58_9BILA